MKDLIKIKLPGASLYPTEAKSSLFTLADINSLSIARQTNDISKIAEVLNRGFSFDVKTLTLDDAWYLMYWHRINSLPSYPHKIPWTCPHCETKNVEDLLAHKLVITEFPEEYFHGMELELYSGEVIKVRVALFGDEITATEFLTKAKIKHTAESQREVVIAQMLSPNGLSLDENYRKLKSLSAEDYLLLESFSKEFTYGVENYVEGKCENPHCASHSRTNEDGTKEVAKIYFNFDLASFFPEFPSRQSVRSRILSSSTSSPTSEGPKGDELRGSNLPSETPPTTLTGREGQDDSSSEQITLTREQLNQMLKDSNKNSKEETPSSLEDLIKDR